MPSTGIPADSTRIFTSGDAFWKPIVASPRLDASTGAIAAKLAESGAHRLALTEQFANPMYNADASTPRYKLNVLNAGTSKWGDNDLNHTTVPIPVGAVPSSGSDGKLIVIDWSTRKVFDLWQLKPNGNTFDVSWGGVYPLDGDGSSHNVMYHDPSRPSPYTVAWPQPVSRGTGSGISSAAGTVRLSEIEAGHIPHALVFATDIPCGPANTGPFRWPATSTDGFVTSGTCIPQGARIQLDPSIDLSKITGISKAELAVGRALQTYGAYVVDKGGSRISFGFERAKAGQPNPYLAAGMSADYFQFAKLPWNTVRVLSSWNGA